MQVVSDGWRPGSAACGARKKRPLVIIGLDGTPGPWLLRSRDEFPNLARVFQSATFGELRSCDPPITVPAWACLFSGKDPGELGLYGFRYRFGSHPAQQRLVHSQLLPPAMLWHHAAQRGAESLLLAIPPSYPPPPVRGCAVSCFLTPPQAAAFTNPPELGERIRALAPSYQFDLPDFRRCDPEQGLVWLRQMTEARFRVARDLVAQGRFDVVAMVEIATDRLHHMFWGVGSDGAQADCGSVVRDFYHFLDEELGLLLDTLGEDFHLWLVSDHGAQPLRGGVFLNEWLVRYGYLRLREAPEPGSGLHPNAVDWRHTVAWAEGGYVGRLYFNVRGREPDGWLNPADLSRLRREIVSGLQTTLRDDEGNLLAVEAWSAEERYRDVTGFPPDLFVYVDELRCRVFGTFRDGMLWSRENDLGYDRANHHPLGFYAYRAPDPVVTGYTGEKRLVDLLPTFLEQMGAVL